MLKKEVIDVVICTSGENLLCLEQLAGSEITCLHQMPLFVISQRIATLATERGFTQVFAMQGSFDNIRLVKQLAKWRKKA